MLDLEIVDDGECIISDAPNSGVHAALLLSALKGGSTEAPVTASDYPPVQNWSTEVENMTAAYSPPRK